MPHPSNHPLTVAEYLASEEQSPYKREYVGGFVYPLHAQAGASKKHTLISGNIFGTLSSHHSRLPLVPKRYKITYSDVTLSLENIDLGILDKN